MQSIRPPSKPLSTLVAALIYSVTPKFTEIRIHVALEIIEILRQSYSSTMKTAPPTYIFQIINLITRTLLLKLSSLQQLIQDA